MTRHLVPSGVNVLRSLNEGLLLKHFGDVERLLLSALLAIRFFLLLSFLKEFQENEKIQKK
jgi:hypothetical protein